MSRLHSGMETSYVGLQWLGISLSNGVEIVRVFFYFSAAGKLFNERRMEICEGPNERVRETRVSLECRPHQTRSQPLAHACLALSARNRYCEHPLVVMGDVIIGIGCAVKKLHGRERELLRHVHHANVISEAVKQVLQGSWSPTPRASES